MTPRRVSLTWLAGFLVLVGCPVLAAADVVHLTNGRTFEGVVAEEGDQQVKIRMESGTLTLPRSLVERIDKSDTNLAEYLRRKQELRQAGGTARAWLDLAQWAQARGLSQAAREAALKSAALDPHLPGVDAILRPDGYVLDAALGRWISGDEEMRRRGMVEVDGEWVSRRELADRQMQEQALYLQSQSAQAAQDTSAAALLLAQMQMSGAAGSPYYGDPYGAGYGDFVLGAGYGTYGFGRHGFRPFPSTRRGHARIPAAVPVPRSAAHGSRSTFRN
jgi:hypothetical protein